MTHYLEYYETQYGGGRGGGIPRIFVGAPYQRGHGIGSFLGGLFRRVLPFLASGARTVGKEALRAGVSIIEDVENNTPLKSAVKTRLKQSGDNLKRKAEEKINNLMKGSGYKSTAKIKKLQFPFSALSGYIAKSSSSSSERKRLVGKKSKTRRGSASTKKSCKKSNRKKKRVVKKKKENKRKNGTGKKRTVSDIFS